MTTVRLYSLVNKLGTSFDMLDPTHFLYGVDGIGALKDESFMRVGDRYTRVNKQNAQRTITGKVAFMGDNPYEDYFSFIDFFKGDKVTLEYVPAGHLLMEYGSHLGKQLSAIMMAKQRNVKTVQGAQGRRYKIDCYLKKISKGEINQYGFLNCEIELICVTPWYRDFYVNIHTGPSLHTETKEYALVPRKGLVPSESLVPDTYLKPITTYGPPEIEYIDVDTDMECPCEIAIFGPALTPMWECVDNHDGGYSSNNVGRMSRGFELKSGEMLKISNMEDPFIVRKYKYESELHKWVFIQDCYQDVDFDYNPFCTLKRGTAFFYFTDERSTNQFGLNGQVSTKIYYEAV